MAEPGSAHRRLRIALLTHSVNPRGGVVHVLELGRALQAAGHAVTLIAPIAPGQALFRSTPCQLSLVPVPAAGPDLARTVEERIQAIRGHLQTLIQQQRFDVFHTHDGIGGNALADLVAQGRIPGYLRTVHHLDRFENPQVQAWEERAVRSARQLLCVSATWRERLQQGWGLRAEQVHNGVDLQRFGPHAEPGLELGLLQRLGLPAHQDRLAQQAPVVLCVGGIEARKNTRRLLQALVQLRGSFPAARLVVAGGASLLNHNHETRAFADEAAAAGLGIGAGQAVVLTGPLSDSEMPALYRCADVLAMPSLLEGFGLAALEALACGTPVVVSRQAPFTEHFAPDEVAWADPLDPAEICRALQQALARGRRLHTTPPPVCQRLSWPHSAARHLQIYQQGLAETRPHRPTHTTDLAWF